jgi:hypothetical protein
MTMLHLTALRNAETFCNPFVGLQFWHFPTIFQTKRTSPRPRAYRRKRHGWRQLGRKAA